jgi:hypothetical protein
MICAVGHFAFLVRRAATIMACLNVYVLKATPMWSLDPAHLPKVPTEVDTGTYGT